MVWRFYKKVPPCGYIGWEIGVLEYGKGGDQIFGGRG